jgi:heme oxygenase (biliverdin-IX-beta and delta-forming)
MDVGDVCWLMVSRNQTCKSGREPGPQDIRYWHSREILMTPAAAPRTLPDSVRSLLRSATADCHAEVDARFAPMVANGASRYAEFLSASAAALWPLERALNAADVTRILPDWEDRSRSAALDADLSELGIPCPAAAPVPRLDGEAFLFGVLYVLEGSRLGAKLLTRQILGSSNPHLHRATRYLQHGEGKPLWQTFLARLESSIAVRRSPERAVAGAVAAFACFAGRLPDARVHAVEAADAG